MQANIFHEQKSLSGRTCRHCKRWTGKQCSHPRHKNRDVEKPCGLYSYKNNISHLDEDGIDVAMRLQILTKYQKQHIVTQILKKMQKKKIEVEDLARSTKIAESKIENLLKGQKILNYKELNRICYFLDLPLNKVIDQCCKAI